MLVLALTEIKQKQLHLEASCWKSQDGWASSPSSSHPHTLRASLFPGTRVEVLGDPWRTKCLDFFHPPVVDSLWLVIMLLQGWKSTCMIYKHTSGGRERYFSTKHIPILCYTYSGSQEKEFLHGWNKKIVRALFLYSDYNYVILYFPSYFLSFSPSSSSLAHPSLAVATCVSSVLPDSFHLCGITIYLVVSLLMLLCR